MLSQNTGIHEADPAVVEILGCHVHNLTMEETLQRISAFVRSGVPHQHVVVNVDKVVKAARDPQLRKIINNCDLINVDGMPIVWASKLLGTPLKERVTGVDLFEALLGRAAAEGWRVYFLGATSEVVQAVAARATRDHPGLSVAGLRDGYWPSSDDAAVAEEIGKAAPHLLFVAISSPRKEQFLGANGGAMKIPFAMGVGGTFDVYSGKVRRAPLWMQRSGLEWFYRFLQEPRRMFRRYFIDDMSFFRLLVVEWARRRRIVRS